MEKELSNYIVLITFIVILCTSCSDNDDSYSGEHDNPDISVSSDNDVLIHDDNVLDSGITDLANLVEDSGITDLANLVDAENQADSLVNLDDCNSEDVLIEDSVEISSLNDLEMLSCTEAIFGDLIINNTDISSISLNKLKIIKGRIEVKNNNDLEHIYMENLVFLSSFDIESNPKLVEMSFDSLKNVENEFIFNFNESIVEVEFNSLELVKSFMDIIQNNSLNSVKFPKLEGVQNLAFAGNPSCVEFGIENLVYSAFDLVIIGNDQLQRINFEKISTIGDAFQVTDNSSLLSINTPNLREVSSLWLWNNNNLLEINFHSISHSRTLLNVVNLFKIENNHSLVSISIPNLNSVSFLEIQNNPSLTEINFSETVEMGPVDIVNNENLTVLNMDSLLYLGRINASGNVNLCQSILDSIIRRINQSETVSVFEGNKDC